ncbi:MAG: D-aminoacylase [Acidobacteriota bacterium]|nr:MAG: D-aminoacylase [Acidobacteriota bacterium]
MNRPLGIAYHLANMKALLFAVISAVCFAQTVIGQSVNTLIRGATVIDGTGRSGYVGDVRIANGKVIKIGRIKPDKSDRVIDAAGLILAPGFIDIHNHSEGGLLTEATAANQISQGITTIIVGPDGGSPWPLNAYFQQLAGRTAVNVGAFIGHGTLRTQVMKNDLARPATKAEIEQMSALLEQAMKEGSLGLSSGLEYDAGFSATTEELIALSRTAAKHGGIYMTHLRDEEEGVMNAIREAIRIGREARIPVQISHIKMGNKSVWGKSAEAVALINEARKSGLDITADAYPYIAWASTITVLVPSRKHEDTAEVQKGIDAIGGAGKVLITSCRAFPAYEGKTLAEAADIAGKSTVETYIEIVKAGGAGVVGFGMNEEDVRTFYQTPWVMASSDGGIGGRHPRGTGTFPRVLGLLAREKKWLSIEEAVRKSSAMPAARLGLKDRGLIKKGMAADLVLFDPKTVIDRATFAEPQLFSEGIEKVFVNGELVWDGEKVTGALPGTILRRR